MLLARWINFPTTVEQLYMSKLPPLVKWRIAAVHCFGEPHYHDPYGTFF